jgi:hypothetical protein
VKLATDVYLIWRGRMATQKKILTASLIAPKLAESEKSSGISYLNAIISSAV